MCENNAVFSMSRSSYNILISQDCNTYEKALNKKKETVAQAVRTAEKYLREARLEEYRAHNSMDVNECLAKVRTAMLADTACGENYKRCLDPTGAYVNGATGEPIYSPQLFKFEKMIKLSGEVGDDILQQNPDFDRELEKYRTNKYVEPQLDTCRSIADIVWNEFKRTAIIEIAQAQANKIEEIKSSCVDTIAECYDTQSQSIVNLGSKRTNITAGALGRYTARDRCQEKVLMCASLYSGAKCEISNGQVTNPEVCGIRSLITYVNTVDDLMVVEKCKAAVDEYLADLCTPDDDTYEYPYKCKGLEPDTLKEYITNYIDEYCGDPIDSDKNPSDDAQMAAYINSAVQDIQDDIKSELADICEKLGGYWDNGCGDGNGTLTRFYSRVYGGDKTKGKEFGCCYENSERMACENYGDEYAAWNASTQQCTFTDDWYEMKCQQLDGVYEDEICYIPE